MGCGVWGFPGVRSIFVACGGVPRGKVYSCVVPSGVGSPRVRGIVVGSTGMWDPR